MNNQFMFKLRKEPILTERGVYFLLCSLKRAKGKLPDNCILEILRIFMPYSISCNGKKELYDICGGQGMFIIFACIGKLGIAGNYHKKDSFFQKFCKEELKNIPLFSPNQIKEFSDYYSSIGIETPELLNGSLEGINPPPKQVISQNTIQTSLNQAIEPQSEGDVTA